MKATITTRAPKFTTSHRKENAGLHKSFAALAMHEGRLCDIAEIRIYWPGSTAYACFWTHAPKTEAHPKGVYISGSGKAGGGGYCKMSAAAGAAINAAGIDLSQDIDGRGAEMVREALLAIAAACGFPDAQIFETHP